MNKQSSGIFGILSGAINKKTGEFQERSTTEMMNTCLDNAAGPVYYCRSKCMDEYNKTKSIDGLKTCQKICNEIRRLNIGACRLAKNWGADNLYSQCVLKHAPECWIGDNVNKECANKNKDILNDCCISNCTRHGELKNCSDYCKLSYRLTTDPLIHSLEDPSMFSFGKTSSFIEQDLTIFYILASSIFVIIFIIVATIITKAFLRN